MSDKKVYVSPQIFRVTLTHEQAILSTCTTPAVNAVAGTGPYCRTANGCKRGTNPSSANNSARPS